MWKCTLLPLLLVAVFSVPSGAQSVAEQYLFASLNAERAGMGLPALSWNSRLANAARRHAWWMQHENAISHGFQGEPELSERAAQAGVRFSTIAENVAVSDNIPAIHDAWVQSKDHHANMIDRRLTSVGIAVVQVAGKQWAVQDFARDIRFLSIPNQEDRVRDVLAGHTVLRSITSNDNARRTCAMNSGYVGRQPWFVMRYTANNLGLIPDQLTAHLRTGRYTTAEVGACPLSGANAFTMYSIAVLLFP